jgi:PEP-CTERM motif
MKKICFFLLLSVTASFLGWADVQYYENASPLNLKADSSWFGITGNFYSGSYVSNNGINVETSAVSLRVGFDTDNLNMWVDRLTFNLAFSPKTMTADNNGVLKSITTTITVNPISIVCRDGWGMDANLPNYRTLFQGTGGAYGLNNTSGWISNNNYNFSTPPKINGTYTTTGPTESQNGSFSINLDGMYFSLPDFINLSKPSQEVVFSAGLNPSHLIISTASSNLPVLYSIVDNVNVVAGLNITAFQLESSQFTLQAIPEPSALSLLAIGLGGLAMMRRRRS